MWSLWHITVKFVKTIKPNYVTPEKHTTLRVNTRTKTDKISRFCSEKERCAKVGVKGEKSREKVGKEIIFKKWHFRSLLQTCQNLPKYFQNEHLVDKRKKSWGRGTKNDPTWGLWPGYFEESSHGMEVSEWGIPIAQLNSCDPQRPRVTSGIISSIQLLFTRNHLKKMSKQEKLDTVTLSRTYLSSWDNRKCIFKSQCCKSRN